MQHKLGFKTKLIAAVVILMGIMAVACCFGSAEVSLKEILYLIIGKKDQLSDSTIIILTKIRVPRILMSAIVGGSLALVGALMQGIFLNPMADPSVLGISSGSALGATVAIVLGLGGGILGNGFTGTYIGAMIGASLTFLFVYSISRQQSFYNTSGILLAGIAISSIMTALITMLMTLHLENMERVYMWMLGSFSSSSLPKLIAMSIVALITITILIVIAPRIDILKLGEETAKTLGVNYKNTMRIILLLSSVLLAFAVASTGIIGFVGLIIPHVVGFFKIYKMRQRLIMSFFAGAIFVVICDTIARTVAAPSEIAIGAITSLVGAPYFLFLLIKNSISYRRVGK